MLTDLTSNDSFKTAVAELRHELEDRGNHLAATSGNILVPLMPAGSLEKAFADLKLLLDEVRRTPNLDSYFNTAREMQEKVNTVSFKYLWTIFPPGELVFSRTFMDCPQAFVVKYCEAGYMEEVRSGQKWILECWTYDWDGTCFNRVPVRFSFDEFKATKPITSLPCYPLRFYRDSPDDVDGAGGRNPGEAMK